MTGELTRPRKRHQPSRTETIPHSDIIGNYETRKLAGAGSKPVTRHTLLRWRELHGFPEPIRILRSGELWDRRAVRAWLAEWSTRSID